MDLQLTGKRAFVTGSSIGIGEEIASALAAEGATVAVHGRDRDRAARVVAQIAADGGKAVMVMGDLTDDIQVEELCTMVREQQADKLDVWLTAARGSALSGFADGIRRDGAAVRSALTLRWSTGPVEGQISRLKTIKRAMCGRTGFELLRRRVLLAA